jgi:hypothetical protein
LDISRGSIRADNIDISSILTISRGRIIANNIDISSTLDISRGRIFANRLDVSAIYAQTIDASNINITSNINISILSGSGGIITISNNYFVHTFLESGIFTPPLFGTTVEALIVGGGGAGAPGSTTIGGLGGGGTVLFTSSTISDNTNYQVTVGAGGSKNGAGSTLRNGQSSSFNGAVAAGGGGGFVSPGTAPGQVGADGTINNILGTSYYWGGGGGNGGTPGGAGGRGGGGGGGGTGGSLGGVGGSGLNFGFSGSVSGAGGDGGANTGGGGGGSGGIGSTLGGNGGSGIVVIRYANTSNPNTINLSSIIAGVSGIANYINSLLARISLLELTAITRTVDVVTPISNSVTIDIDLSNNNSVEIHATVRFYGSTSNSRLYAGYNNASGSQLFRDTAIEVALQSGDSNQIYTSGNSFNTGMLMYDMNVTDYYGNTNSLVFKIVRPYDMLGLVEGGYMGHSLWSNITGRFRGEFFGNYDGKPTSLRFFTTSNTTFQARYSIVSDKRH